MSQTITQGRLRINANFKRFVDEEVLPGTGLDTAAFWRNFDEIVHDLAPENRQLLAERDRIQAALDEWHRSNPGPVKDKEAYKSFLRELGYLVPQPERVTVETTGIDSEITSQAGPQLVVPAMNARYALNAANARWGSLYDALYGSDIIPQEGAMVSGYDPQRGEQVIAWVRRFLDESLPPLLHEGDGGKVSVRRPGSVMNQQAYNRYSSIISSSSRFSRLRATAQFSSSACDLCFNSSVQGCMEWAHIRSYQHSHISVW